MTTCSTVGRISAYYYFNILQSTIVLVKFNYKNYIYAKLEAVFVRRLLPKQVLVY